MKNELEKYIETIEAVDRAKEAHAVARLQLGKAVRLARQAKKLSLKYVAARIDVSAPYLYDFELGRRGIRDDLVMSLVNAIQDYPYGSKTT